MAVVAVGTHLASSGLYRLGYSPAAQGRRGNLRFGTSGGADPMAMVCQDHSPELISGQLWLKPASLNLSTFLLEQDE